MTIEKAEPVVFTPFTSCKIIQVQHLQKWPGTFLPKLWLAKTNNWQFYSWNPFLHAWRLFSQKCYRIEFVFNLPLLFEGGVDIRDICPSKFFRLHVFLRKKLKIISEKLVGLEWSKKQGGICNQMIKLNKIYWSGDEWTNL